MMCAWAERVSSRIVPTVQINVTPRVIGAQLCAWEEGGEIQVPALRPRVAPVSERIWNPEAPRSWDDFRARAAATDAVLTKLIAGIPLDDEK